MENLGGGLEKLGVASALSRGTFRFRFSTAGGRANFSPTLGRVLSPYIWWWRFLCVWAPEGGEVISVSRSVV